jgi:hypothetical protein
MSCCCSATASRPSNAARGDGARRGVFGAACHYADGTIVFADAESKCAQTSPQTGAKFNFWHPPLVTLHIWLWYPNPSGLYSGTKPLVTRSTRADSVHEPDEFRARIRSNGQRLRRR